MPTANHNTDLAGLLAAPERIGELSLEQVPAMLVQVAALQSALAAKLLCEYQPRSVSPSHDSEGACYLGTRDLARRIPYSEKTLRNLKSTGEFKEGKHYLKRRGRVMWVWSAMKEWFEERGDSVSVDVPLVRSQRYGRSR